MTSFDLHAEVAGWPVGRASVAVLDPSGVLDRVDAGGSYPLASVTKIITSLAVLDGCADGTVSLDDEVGPPRSTLRHLLSHAAGLAFDERRAVVAVGTRRNYSNAGIEWAADHLADQAGGPFLDELHGRVLRPLGMTDTTVNGSPAKDGVSTLQDLILLAWELLVPRVLGSEIVSAASTLQFPGLSGVLPGFGRQTNNDWGLGCEIRDSKSPHWTSPENSPSTFGHFGQHGGFLWVDPELSLACVGLADTLFGPWAAEGWPRLSTGLIHAYR